MSYREQIMKNLLSLLLLLPILAQAAIGVRATASGTNGFGTSISVNIPTGTTTNDVTVVAVGAPGAGQTLTIPSGWTTIYKQGGTAIIYRVFQAGDPSTITVTAGSTGFNNAAAISYTGVDNSAPIDTSNSCALTLNNLTLTKARAPSTNPNWNNARLLLVAFDQSGASGAITNPAGFTSQKSVSSTGGPDILLTDKVLTDGTNTGTVDVTIANNPGATVPSVGAQIVLKASGATAASPIAAARPVFAGINYEFVSGTGTSLTLPTLWNVSDGDVVVVNFVASSGITITPASGYSNIGSGDNGSLVYSHTWHTGDTTAPVFTFNTSNPASFNILILHKSGVSTHGVALDVSGTATGTGSVSVGSLTPATTVDVALFFAGTANSNTGTITGLGPGSMTNDVKQTAHAPMSVASWQADVSSSLGAFTATIAPSGGSQTNGGSAFLYEVAATATAAQPTLILGDRRAQPAALH